MKLSREMRRRLFRLRRELAPARRHGGLRQGLPALRRELPGDGGGDGLKR